MRSQHIINFPDPFVDTAAAGIAVPLLLLDTNMFHAWIETQSTSIQALAHIHGFTAKPGQCLPLHSENGNLQYVLAGIRIPLGLYDLSKVCAFLHQTFSADFLREAVFVPENTIMDTGSWEQACIGWALECYKFDTYKKPEEPFVFPQLAWPNGVNRDRVRATISSVCLIRNLVNTPANVLGTEELADVAHDIAKQFGAKFRKISGKDLVKQNFPLIHAVGRASTQPSVLAEINWGDDRHPCVTLVGKGIVFDTGGLNLKPGRWMDLMKKDMGGAAHALGLAWMVMALRLPVRLRVILPIAENAVAGDAFRPGDIIPSRKGLNVEIGDTDAEGRLVVADALAYACEAEKKEDKPDLLVDFCTLTGAARVALGYDIPAYFSNREALIDGLRHQGSAADDPVWPLPLWDGYDKEIDTAIADVANDGKGRAGAIHGGLFLKRFVDPDIDWLHLDLYAWAQTGKPGRPQGGADTGMRAVFKLLESRYG